jgi:predicted ATPase/DNA-binding winged helix-turn-helix (wHTH) protein/Tfp pilus assembly protein PilF
MTPGASAPIRLRTGEVDLGRQRLMTPDGPVSLTTRESELLAYLADRAGEPVARDDLLVDVWNYKATNPTRAVDLAVKRLRAKIEPDPSNPIHVLSVHGVGYRFVPLQDDEPVAVPVVEEAPTASVRTNLTPDRTSFVGRSDDLARLAELLDKHRLVTILGTAGTGKTRLARRHAADHADELPGGAWFVDLSDTRTLPDVLSAVSEAFELPVPVDATGEAVARALAQKLSGPALLVLDNFEQVVGASAAEVGQWLDFVPDVRLVITSRERLHIRGEVLLELAPLTVDEGLQLLVDRAEAVRPHGAFSDEDREVLADVVRALDGIPLAIELAASRLGTLSPTQLQARLHKRFRLLGDRRSDRPARHATLQAAFDWSWGLLGPVEQRALAALSVFEGGFSLEAAEEVLEHTEPDAPWTADLIQGLRDKSFVAVDQDAGADMRYRLLESVRAYAARKLKEDGRADDVRTVHAAYYVREGEALAEGLYGNAGLDRLRDLARERANLVAVAERAPEAEHRVRAALVLQPLLAARGPHAVLQRVLDNAILSARYADDMKRELGLLLGFRARLGYELGHWAVAERDAEEAIQVAPLRPGVRARALTTLAVVRNQQGRHREALVNIREALEATTRLGDRRLEGQVRVTFARLLEFQECVEEAGAEYDRALRILRRAGDRWTEGALLSTFASFLLTKRHLPDEADAAAEEALALLLDIGDYRRSTQLLAGFGTALVRLRRPKEAIAHLVRARELAQQMGDRSREGFAASIHAWALLELGDLDEAETVVAEASRLARRAGHRGREAVVQRLKAVLRMEQGRMVEARTLLEESLEALEELGDRAESAVSKLTMALLHVELGEDDEALQAFEQATASLDGTLPWLGRQSEAFLAVLEARRGQLVEGKDRLSALASTVDPRDLREFDLLEPCRATVDLLWSRLDGPEEEGRALRRAQRILADGRGGAVEYRVARRVLQRQVDALAGPLD